MGVWDAVKAVLLTVAVLAAAGVMAWAISNAVDSSRTAADAAKSQAIQRSTALVASQEVQLQQALWGECQGRNALTRQVDATHHVLHDALEHAAQLTRYAAQSHIPRPFRHVEKHLSRDYLASARLVKAVTLTDCLQELRHPLRYRKPRAVPFSN